MALPQLSPFDLRGRRHLASPEGLAVLRGFNISGASKLIGLPWSAGRRGSALGRARSFLSRLRDDGFTLIRVPVLWERLERQEGVWDPDGLLPEIKAFLDLAGELGFRVLLDFHQDVLGELFHPVPPQPEIHGDGFPGWFLKQAWAAGGGSGPLPEGGGWRELPGVNWALNLSTSSLLGNRHVATIMRGLAVPGIARRFGEFASRVATAFRECGNIIGYDVINEQNEPWLADAEYGTFYAAVTEGLRRAGVGLNEYTPASCFMPAGNWLDVQKCLLPAIAASGADIHAGIPSAGLAGAWLSTAHFYDPGAESHSRLVPSRPGRYEAAVDAALALHDQWRAVMLVGEFGLPNDMAGWPNPPRGKLLSRWLDIFEARGVSWCAWNFNPDATEGGDDHWCGEKFSFTSAARSGEVSFDELNYRDMVRPAARRLSGNIEQYQWTPGDAWRLQIRVGQAPRAGWSSEIYVPPEFRPWRVLSFVGADPPRLDEGNATLTFTTEAGPSTLILGR